MPSTFPRIRWAWFGALLVVALVAFVGCFPQAARGRFVAPRHVPDISRRVKSPALIKAAGAGDLERVTALLAQGVSPDAVELYDNLEATSALECAVCSGNLEVVRLLLDRGADVNADNAWGGTAIHAAAVWGRPEIAKLLIARGADVNADDDGASPLGYAKHALSEAKSTEERERFRRTVEALESAGAVEWWPFLPHPH